jgi:hypothetical protein
MIYRTADHVHVMCKTETNEHELSVLLIGLITILNTTSSTHPRGHETDLLFLVRSFFLPDRNLGFMLVGQKLGALDFGFTITWILGFHQRVLARLLRKGGLGACSRACWAISCSMTTSKIMLCTSYTAQSKTAVIFLKIFVGVCMVC